MARARSRAQRTTKAATTASKRAVGQAGAERAETVDAGVAAAERLLDAGARAVEPDVPNPGTADEEWTKTQVDNRAQELDVDRRSSLFKKQLAAALRAA